jgi:hypothetical protein
MTARQHYAWGHAYRAGSLVCARVHITFHRNDQLGPAHCDRRTVIARFEDRLHPMLRAELDELARCHAASARRAAERLEPIVLLVGDPRHGQERIVGRLLLPRERRDDLHEIEFRLHELTP